MVIERSDAGQSYPPLPIREIRKENSARPAINVHLDQISRQLAQLIGELQQLNHRIPVLREEMQISQPSDSSKVATEKNTKNQNYPNRKYQLSKITNKRLGDQGKFSKFVNGILLFFLVTGIAAALFAAIVLFFRGPTMI